MFSCCFQLASGDVTQRCDITVGGGNTAKYLTPISLDIRQEIGGNWKALERHRT